MKKIVHKVHIARLNFEIIELCQESRWVIGTVSLLGSLFEICKNFVTDVNTSTEWIIWSMTHASIIQLVSNNGGETEVQEEILE